MRCPRDSGQRPTVGGHEHRTRGSSVAAPLGDADGVIADNNSISPFGTSKAAIRNLDPALLAAVQQAARDAQQHGITVKITSGWRDKAYQQQLLDDVVRKYGTLAAARQYVNTPEKSTHVAGKAVDIGPTDADDWVDRHGADYGLCQAYSNETWHFELLTQPGGECPPQLPDAAGRKVLGGLTGGATTDATRPAPGSRWPGPCRSRP